MVTKRSETNPALKNKKNELPFELNFQAASTWIEDLPITNKMETSRLLYSTLQSLNRHTFSPQLRLQILEIFRPVILLQSKYLESHTIGAQFPLIPKIRKIAKLSAKFHIELATGYKYITNNSAFTEDFTSVQQATVIHRAMQLIGCSMLRIAQMYEPPSSRVWGEIKTLYLIAQKNGLLETNVEDEISAADKPSTINAAFKKIVLFWISHPYRYPQNEIQNLFDFWEKHTDKVKITSGNSANEDDATISIDLENSYPPMHVSWANYGSHLRYFNIQKMANDLARPDRLRAKRENLDPQSLTRLVHHLGGYDEPLSSKTEQEIDMTVGLEHIVEGLTSKTKKTPKLSALPTSANWIEAPNYDLLPLNNNKPFDPSFDNTLATADSGSSEIEIPPNKIWATKQRQPLKTHHFKCEVQANDLENHLFIELREQILPIGELIALHYPGKRNQIGIIRWQQPTTNEYYVLYGIELIASEYTLVDVIFDSKKHSDVLYLSNPDQKSSQYSILIPPAKYRSGSRFTLRNQRETKNMTVEKLLETNPLFCHYSVSNDSDFESAS